MKRTTIILAVGLAVLLLAPGASRTQDLKALQGLPGTQGLTSGCYRVYSLTYGVLYGDIIYADIGPNGIITGTDYAVCQFPVSGIKKGADFILFLDFPWETCPYPAAYTMGIGTGLKGWAYAFDLSGNPYPPEHFQLVPCSVVADSVSSGIYFGTNLK
jgi:hypothetical protein